MGESITFTLDGKTVDARAGETIWQAARRHGVEIPHLCYAPEPDYRPDGNCRACMVEVEGERVLAPSCLRVVAEGMVVNSASARAKQSRELVMELLVADQPPREVAHDRDSKLWQWAEKMDVATSRFESRAADEVPVADASHPAMHIALDACIQCNLCVPAFREVPVNGVIRMASRGHRSNILFRP